MDKSIYQKLTEALAQVDGNVMLDPGVQFVVKEIAKDLETSVCCRCYKIVPSIEIERNEGICAHCAIHEEIK